ISADNPAAVIDCDIAALAPGQDAVCSANLTITQDDVETGEVAFTSSVTANAPAGTDPATVNASRKLTIPTANTPDIVLRNNAAEDSKLVPGQPVEFTMT